MVAFCRSFGASSWDDYPVTYRSSASCRLATDHRRCLRRRRRTMTARNRCRCGRSGRKTKTKIDARSRNHRTSRMMTDDDLSGLHRTTLRSIKGQIWCRKCDKKRDSLKGHLSPTLNLQLPLSQFFNRRNLYVKEDNNKFTRNLAMTLGKPKFTNYWFLAFW